MLGNVFQYDTLQKLDLSNNNLAEVENLLQVTWPELSIFTINFTYLAFLIVLVSDKLEEFVIGFYWISQPAPFSWKTEAPWRTFTEEQ